MKKAKKPSQIQAKFLSEKGKTAPTCVTHRSPQNRGFIKHQLVLINNFHLPENGLNVWGYMFFDIFNFMESFGETDGLICKLFYKISYKIVYTVSKFFQ